MNSLLSSIIFILCGFILISHSDATMTAHARVFGTTGNDAVSGTFSFIQTDSSSEVTIGYSITGLAPNQQYAVHVHTWGDLTYPNGTRVGGHYNPANVSHACYPTAVRHAGDIGNITSDSNGAASAAISRDLLQLSGNTSIIGRAIMIHQNGDQCIGAAGNAGPFIAMGVIGYGNAVNDSAASDPLTTSVFVAVLKGTTGHEGITGAVYFQAVGNSIQAYARVIGLQAGNSHGFHIHAYGDLSNMVDGTSAGGHYNPSGVAHGLPTESIHHIGDLGNAEVASDGQVYFNKQFSFLTFSHLIGRAIVLHNNTDQGSANQPVGGAGFRLALGVIGHTNQAFPTVVQPPGSTDTTSAASMNVAVSPFVMFACALIAMAKYFF